MVHSLQDSKSIKVLIKNNLTGEVFEDEFWPDSTYLHEILEIFDEEYGNEEFTLLRIDRPMWSKN